METSSIVEIIKHIASWLINFSPKIKCEMNIPVTVKISALPSTPDWFFTKYPYKIEIELINKTENAFFIESAKIQVANQSYTIMEYEKIKNDVSPRDVLRPIAVQAKEAKKVEGIIEIGYGFQQQNQDGRAELILQTEKKNLKYKIDFPLDIKT